LNFLHFNQQLIYFYLPILILSICDPLAALVGKKWAYGKYKVGNDYKTIMGSLAFFMSCLVIMIVSFYSSLEQESVFSLLFYSALISILVTGTEACCRKGFDNLAIPITVMLGLILI
jgi:dolichol kinase